MREVLFMGGGAARIGRRAIVGSIPTLARHIFQVVWCAFRLKSNTSNIIFNWLHTTKTHKNRDKNMLLSDILYMRVMRPTSSISLGPFVSRKFFLCHKRWFGLTQIQVYKAVFHFYCIVAKLCVFYCVHIIISAWVLTKQWNSLRFATI